jgi:drug/metabolite transporter (DMT)-like permease
MRHRAVILTGLAQGSAMLLFVLANKSTTAANAIFLQCAAPLYIPMLASRVLGERATRRDLAAMAGIAAGLVCFFVGSQQPSATAPQPRLGDLLAIASGVAWACTVVGLRYLARGGVMAAGAAKGALLWGNLFVAAVALPIAFPLPATGGTDWGVLVFLGVAQVALAYRLLVRAVARVPALEASLLALFEPVLNPVWAFALLGEKPSSWALAGAAILATVTIARAVAGSRQQV